MCEIMTEKGVTLGSLANWTFTLVMALITSILIDLIGGYFFIIFGFLCCVNAVFVIVFVKETKGLSEA